MNIVSLFRVRALVYFSIIVILSTFSGCASAPPTIGPHAETGELESVTKIPLSAALLLSDNLDNYRAKQNASGWFGRACQIEMSFGPTIAKSGVAEFGRLFNSVVPTTDLKVASTFDLIIEPSIERFSWRSTGLSSSAAAVELSVSLQKGGKVIWQKNFMHERESEIDTIKEGCGSALIIIRKASTLSVETDLQSAVLALSGDKDLRQSTFESASDNITPKTSSSNANTKCASGKVLISHQGETLTITETDAIEFLRLGLVSDYQCIQ